MEEVEEESDENIERRKIDVLVVQAENSVQGAQGSRELGDVTKGQGEQR